MTPLNVQQQLAHRTLLATGATGFLGKVWVAQLLQDVPQLERIVLVMRAGTHSTAEERFQEMAEQSPAFRALRTHWGPEFREQLAKKTLVLDGDVTLPLLGLDWRWVTPLLRQIDVVVNLAGLTHFNPDPRQAFATNTQGARHAAEITRHTRGIRLIHISTAFVAGNLPQGHRGKTVPPVQETVRPAHTPNGTNISARELRETFKKKCMPSQTGADTKAARQQRKAETTQWAQSLGWPNIYTLSKGIAEMDLCDYPDIQTTIVRPSVVESARAYPFAGWNEGVNTSSPLVWLLSTPFRRFPANPNHRFDVVPVDLVARGMTLEVAHILEGADLTGPNTDPNTGTGTPAGTKTEQELPRVVHLSSGTRNALNFERAIELTAMGVRLLHDQANQDLAEGREPLARNLGAQIAGIHTLDAIAHHAPEHFLQRLNQLEAGLSSLLRQLGRATWADKLHSRVTKLVQPLRRIHTLLNLYRPFILDNDYHFVADHIGELSDRLPEDQKHLFEYDIETLDWRTYWVHTHVPGLALWSLPLIHNRPVPNDGPLPATQAVVAHQMLQSGTWSVPRDVTQDAIPGQRTSAHIQNQRVS